MDYILFIKCIVSGFLLAAPIGPVNLICIRRTLSDGRVTGLIVGMGAAIADALYGYVAATGLSSLTTFILHYGTVFRWGGGVFVIYLGIRTFRAAPRSSTTAPEENSSYSLYRLFTGIFFLTLTNPVTVFAFIAAFSSLGIAMLVTNFFTTVLATAGVFIGSGLWWITLTSIVCLFRTRMTPNVILRVNKVAGIIIILIGLASLETKISL